MVGWKEVRKMDNKNKWNCSWVSPAEMLIDGISYNVKSAYGREHYSDAISIVLREFNSWFWGKGEYGEKHIRSQGADDFALLRVLQALSLISVSDREDKEGKEDRDMIKWMISELQEYLKFYGRRT